jgi:hypothetical protein
MNVGVILRGSQEANQLLANGRTTEQKRRYAQAANIARRTNHPFIESERSKWGHKRCLTSSFVKQSLLRNVGKGEAELYNLLILRNPHVVRQTPLYGYNLDLSIGRIAVEVHRGCDFPFRHPHRIKKVVDLGNLGWCCIFVWLAGELPTNLSADAIITFVEEVNRNPLTVTPQYRVIRRSGETAAAGKSQLNEIALVPLTGDCS